MADDIVKTPEKEKQDIRQAFTDKLVASLEAGKIPWRKPWDQSKGFTPDFPRNAMTDKPYKGGNSLMLMVAAMDGGYTDNRWATFNQVKNLKGHVNAGEKSTQIEYWERRSFYERKDITIQDAKGAFVKVPKGAKETDKTIETSKGVLDKSSLTITHNEKQYSWKQAEKNLDQFIQKTHYVFNVEQTTGMEIKPLQDQSRNLNEPERHQKAEDIAKGMKADGVSISHKGDSAFYVQETDSVQLPPRDVFENAEGYYGTLLHELGHSTGHDKRFKRDMNHPFGSEGYAKEELVAEITSAFTSNEVGIPFDGRNHEAYIQSWASVLKNDKNAIFVAAKNASQATDYLIEKGRAVEQERDQAKGLDQDKDKSESKDKKSPDKEAPEKVTPEKEKPTKAKKPKTKEVSIER